MRIKSEISALAQFEESARLCAVATESGDWKTKNKHIDMLHEVVQYLRDSKRLEALVPYLDDFRLYVQIPAATALLSINESRAITTLEQAALDPGIQGLIAQMVLKEWRAGNLKF